MYNLTDEAKVSFIVINTMGEIVKIIPMGIQPTGMNIYNFNGSQLSQGVYMVRCEVSGEHGFTSETNRMVITK